MDKNRGISVVVVIVIVALLAVAGGAAYYFYTQNNKPAAAPAITPIPLGNTNTPRPEVAVFSNPNATLAAFAANAEFTNDCSDGEGGIFKPDGTLTGTSATDNSNPDPEASPSLAGAFSGTWSVTGNIITLTGTTLSNGPHTMKFVNFKDERIAVETSRGTSCGILIGSSEALLGEYLTQK